MSLFRRRSGSRTPPPEAIAAGLHSLDPTATVSLLRPEDATDVVLVELAPTQDNPWFTVTTAGPGLLTDSDCTRQLVVALPPSFGESERGEWTSSLLVATFAYGCGATLRAGNTIGNGEPPGPYSPGAPFCGSFLWSPLITPKQFEADGSVIELLAVIPLHLSELAVARREGHDALLDGLDDIEASELLDLTRPAAV